MEADVGLGLGARAEHSERGGVGPGQDVGRQRRIGRRLHRGETAAVEHRERHAGHPVEEGHERVDARQALRRIAGEHRRGLDREAEVAPETGPGQGAVAAILDQHAADLTGFAPVSRAQRLDEDERR